jgi:uncharacterized protein involved in exopolysaccharide biosynthesis
LLIATILGAALPIASIVLVLMGPRYTSEATIQLNFIREEPVTGTKIQPIATMDAAALVDSAARVIRSRATASAVVARLRLDRDPDFARESTLWRVFSELRAQFGLKKATPTPRDLAVNRLMGSVSVTNDPRAYLISVAITSGDPDRAATLANAVALEYLRGQLLQQLADAEAAAERELNQLASLCGVPHPNYVLARTRLESLQSRISAWRDMSLGEDDVKLMTGQCLLRPRKSWSLLDPTSF